MTIAESVENFSLIEKLLPSAIVALFVSVIWAAIFDNAKTKRSFILSTVTELKAALKQAMLDGNEFWHSSSTDKSKERGALIAAQAEIVGLISLLEKFGYDPKNLREDFCDALTGGNFDANSRSDLLAAASLNSANIALRISIDEFLIYLIRRPLLRLLLTPFRKGRKIWNKLLN